MKEKYYIKYQGMRYGTVKTLYLHFGEEKDIIKAVEDGEDILRIVEEMVFERCYRVALIKIDENDKKHTVIDSKFNKLQLAA